MRYLNSKMQLKVTIPALTCAIISTAAAVLLVCATNQTKDEGAKLLNRISSALKATNSSAIRTALVGELDHEIATQTRLKSSMRLQNGTIQADRRQSGDIKAQASILRPLFMKHLLSGGKRKPASSAPQELEEEEEVTKTIMVPVNPEDAEITAGGKHSEAVESSLEPNEPMIQYMSGHQMKLSGSHKKAAAAFKGANQQQSMAIDTSAMQPNAEASLRLTSTEIGGLLNDREAPEFYRERELNGDGVLVGEERPSPVSASHNSFTSSSSRLGMAASGHFGNQFMGGNGAGFGPESVPYGNNLGYDSSEAALYRHRLSQAASEEAYGGGAGFNHRFGQQSFGSGGGGDGELGYGPATGGLMQAPNEYNEVNSMGSSAGYTGEGQPHSYGAGDYSPQSGFLRAGSEGLYGGAGGLAHGMAGLAGYMGHGGPLETAAAGGYGPGGAEMGSSGDLMGHPNAFSGAGRLQAHASYNPYMQSAGEADYTSRFGQHQAGGFTPMGDYADQRGFASQNNQQMVRSATSGIPHSPSMSNSRGLLPFTPTVPLPEDLPSPVTQPSVLSSNQREQISRQPANLAQLLRHQQNLDQRQSFTPRTRPSHQQVHEALEEDPTDTSSDDEPTGGHQQQAQQNYETITSTNEAEESATSARPPQEQQMGKFAGELGPSLVLNVPPPADQSAAPPISQLVEFSRVGSAGYLGPRALPLTKKSGHRFSQTQQEADSEEDGSSSSASEPLENPAHAGKYIID